LRSTLAEKDAETRALRTQVRGLKEFVSTSTRTDGQQAATDESLAEGLAMLANGLQNWVITNFRKAKLRTLEELDEETRADAGELLPMFEDLVSQGSKVHLLQSIVSRLLVDEVLEAYYAGLSEQQTEQLRETEKLLATFGEINRRVKEFVELTCIPSPIRRVPESVACIDPCAHPSRVVKSSARRDRHSSE
jgi:hypothetical protein